MIVAGQVENSVHQQSSDHQGEGMSRLMGTPGSEVYVQNDISEQDFASRSSAPRISEGEREHIRCLRLAPVAGVETFHGLIVGEQNAQFTGLQTQSVKKEVCVPPQSLHVYSYPPLGVSYRDCHPRLPARAARPSAH